MKFTGERVILGESDITIEKEHIDRYNFAAGYIKNKNVLDIACGSGYGADLLAKNGAARVYGMDVSKETISYAKRKYNQSKKISFVSGDACNLHKFKDNYFDVIISFETIEHIKNYNKFLAELKRVLSKKGKLIISTPNKKYHSPNSIKPLNPYHIKEFYPNEFKESLSSHFKLVKLYGQDEQSLLKNIIQSIVLSVPKSLRQAFIPQNIRDTYNTNIVSYVNDKPQISRYLIAICER